MESHTKPTETSAAAPTGAQRRGPLPFLKAFKNYPPNEPIFQDEYARVVVPKGWGMKELRAIVKPDITPPSFSEREEFQEKMHQYFEYELDIFRDESKPLLPNAPWLVAARRSIVGFLSLAALAFFALCCFFAFYLSQIWLIVASAGIVLACALTFGFVMHLMRRMTTDGRWPGLMEERVTVSINDKFPTADDYVRKVIDHYTDLFLDNNWMFSRLKRLFQGLAIVGVYIAFAPLVYLLLFMPSAGLPLMGVAAIWAAVFTAAALWGFHGINDHIFEDKYYQSLQNSAQDVSNVIRDRMSAINRHYQLTYSHLVEIQGTGEAYRGEKQAQQIADAELKDHMAFFDTQLLIWLGKRLEYIELHLYNRFHSALTIHACMTVAGFVSNLVIFLLGLTPAVLLIGHAGFGAWSAIQTGDQSALTNLGAAASVGVVAAVLIWLVSHWSYNNAAWNSLKTMEGGSQTIFESHFDAKDLQGWQTYQKLGLENNLAGRIQKAMITIRSLYDKIGFGGGQPGR